MKTAPLAKTSGAVLYSRIVSRGRLLIGSQTLLYMLRNENEGCSLQEIPRLPS